MKSPLPKVVHPVLGVPMVIRVVHQAVKAGFDKPVVVVGHGRDGVIQLLESEGIPWAVQEEQLGTAHAVSCGLKDLIADDITVLLGDVPLLRSRTITDLVEARREADAAVAVLTAFPPDSTGYGRIVRDGNILSEIVEERDTTPEQQKIGEINTGIMSFDGSILPLLLEGITTDNDQNEYYLTDAISIARKMGKPVVKVLGTGHATDTIALSSRKDVTWLESTYQAGKLPAGVSEKTGPFQRPGILSKNPNPKISDSV